MMRRIGRRESEASPIRVDIEGMGGDDAAEHAHGAAGIAAIERRRTRARRPRTPRPSMVTSGGSPSRGAGVRETIAPRALMQERVEAQSAPGA